MRKPKNPLFFALNETEDSFEVDILNKIQEDYLKYHENHLMDYLYFLNKELHYPNCKSVEVIKYKKIKVDQYAINASHDINSLKDSLFFSSKINLKA